MSLEETSDQISDLLAENRSVFLRTEPEVPDFTVGAPFRIFVYGHQKIIEIETTPKNIVSLVALFDATIFDKSHIDRLYVWNIKPLATYLFYISKRFLGPQTNVLDLKIIESFLGFQENAPKNISECVNRFKAAVQHKSWNRLYKPIHLPLALRVLPAIETQPLLNEQTKRSEFPYYEIEGQINGRMNCLRKYARSYLPHNMGPEIKSVLKPRGYGMRFLCSDFRHCEVTVLQWLSSDDKLKKILESGLDLHEQIYENITGDQCNTDNKRRLSKKMFLPVMYGCGANGLAKNLGVSDTVASELITRIKNSFSTAWDWMQSKQEEAKTGSIHDFFGRTRQFEPNQSYLARNFSVQGVAATVCQEKLIDLFNNLDNNDSHIAFSVHDGFGLICKTNYAHETYKLVKQVCESDSKLCTGLKMKVEIKFGIKLDKMKVLWKD